MHIPYDFQALGAITRGDRRASTGAAQMSSFNFNNRASNTNKRRNFILILVAIHAVIWNISAFLPQLYLFSTPGLGRITLKTFYDNICSFGEGSLTPASVMRNLRDKTRETRYPLGMIDAVSF